MEKLHISFDTPLRVVLEQPQRPYRAIITFQIGDLVFSGENMSNTMQAGTRATVSVEWKDKGGQTVKVDGPTKWDSSDPSVCQATVSTGNPQIANLYAPGPIGKVQVHATADADLGDGVRAVTATTDVEVIAGEAVSGDIKFTQSPPQTTQSGKTGGQTPSGKPGGQTPPSH